MLGDRYRSFTNKVRVYEPESLIRLIASTAANRFFNRQQFNLQAARFFRYPEAAFPDFVLAAIVKAICEIPERKYYRRDRTPALADLGKLQDLFLNCPIDEPMESMDDLQRWFFRTAYLQFPTHHGSWKQIPRALLLHSQEQGAFDAESAFASAVGISLKDFVFIGLSLFVLSRFNRDGGLPLEIFSKVAFEALQRPKIEAFLERTSATIAKLRSDALTIVRTPGYEIYEHNPLFERPVIQLSDGSLVLPVPTLILDRVTDGIYYDLAKAGGGQFLTHLGHAYESYVGKLFEHHTTLHLEAEREYGPKSAKKRTVDWLVSNGSSSLLLECKTKRLRINSPSPYRPQQLLDDLKAGVVTAVKQLWTTRKAMDERLVFADRSQDEVFPLIVTLGDSYLFNSDPVRSLLANETSINPDDFVYQVVSLDEIEDLTSLEDASDIFEVLRKKVESPDKRQYD
jgi:hypothetical protein